MRPSNRNRQIPYRAGLFFLYLFCLIIQAPAQEARGLPYIRAYPLDEIGRVPSGLRLGFDAFGRVAVMYNGVYSVLNDSTWVDRIDHTAKESSKMSNVTVANGTYYYGGRGSWGIVEQTADGRLKPVPLKGPDAPAWTNITPFNKLLLTGAGVYFYEINGLVYWDYSSRRNWFLELPRITTVFAVGSRVFISCQDESLHEVHFTGSRIYTSKVEDWKGQTVGFATRWDDKQTLLGLRDGSLAIYDGKTTRPWEPQRKFNIYGRVTALERLMQGGVAIAIAHKGLFIVARDETLVWALELPEFRRIENMAAGEPGVLWIAGGNAVHRVLYDTPLTNFGQSLGLTTIWPHVFNWNNRTIVCSNNILYEMDPCVAGHTPNFRVLVGSRTQQADFAAANQQHLLVGNPQGVYRVDRDGNMEELARLENVAGLAFVDPDTCLAIGSKEITALRYSEGRWGECAQRIQGIGNAPVVTHCQKDVWIEMGGDRVARLSLNNGVLKLERITLPWNGEQWTNIGIARNTIIFSAAYGQRAYYDARTGAFIKAPELEALLGQSPYWLSRITEDDSGILWATHDQGVVTFSPTEKGYVVDSTTFELRNDSYPTISLLPGNNTWICTSRSLYHVERRGTPETERPGPRLVSLMADQQNTEMLTSTGEIPPTPSFSYDRNSLSLLFFSGTYAWRFPPRYEYRLGDKDNWTSIEPSSSLRLPKLRDGNYQLEVRQTKTPEAKARPILIPFKIEPPWYRTPASFIIYFIISAASVFYLNRWLSQHSLEKNIRLERLVQERTNELGVAMEKLGEKTKNAAILAERSRLAGEIHDSVQQGISGVILLMDTTLQGNQIASEMHAQLTIMRSMLSYSREEVQQAVWNLESPLLQNSSLGEALKKLAGYIHAGSAKIVVHTNNDGPALEPRLQHNLLRIAQEAITNAVKHATATRIEVSLHTEANKVILSVSDDGAGFEAGGLSEEMGHLGLRGQRVRARAVGANLSIVSSPGKGTTVRVEAPTQTASQSAAII